MTFATMLANEMKSRLGLIPHWQNDPDFIIEGVASLAISIDIIDQDSLDSHYRFMTNLYQASWSRFSANHFEKDAHVDTWLAS